MLERQFPLTDGLLAAFGLLIGLAVAPTIACYCGMDPRTLWEAGGATALFIAGFGAARVRHPARPDRDRAGQLLGLGGRAVTDQGAGQGGSQVRSHCPGGDCGIAAQRELAFPQSRRFPVNATDQQTGVRPTIVLVHGAFADASSWNSVIERLQQQGYTVIALANPLRGLAADSAYTASLLNQIDGPVLLAGHSYGGVVITNAATSAPNVVGLVYVAAFAIDEGETLGEADSHSKDSILNTALVQYRYPAGADGETSVELAINPALPREAFAADLPPETHRADGRDPAPHRGDGVQRSLRAARLAEAAVLDGSRHRRQGRRRRRHPV